MNLLGLRSKIVKKDGWSSFWRESGQIDFRYQDWDLDIFSHSQNYGSGLIDAFYQPLGDLVCPSNLLSGTNFFPPGGKRSFGPTSRPGHESVGYIVAATKSGWDFLEKQKNFHPFKPGALNINLGCGQCKSCRLGGCPDVCYNGQTFQGLGSFTEENSDSWVMKETGRREIPGFLCDFAVPISTRQFYSLPDWPATLESTLVYGMADGVGCCKNAIDLSGILSYHRYYKDESPRILVFGAGKLGLLTCLVLQDLLPKCEIVIADKDNNAIERLKKFVNVHSTFLFKSCESEINSLVSHGINGRYHCMINCASHDALAASDLIFLAANCLHRRGRIVRMDHVPIDGLMCGFSENVLNQITHVSGLGPADNFSYALELIQKHNSTLKKSIYPILGEFEENLSVIKEVTETNGVKLRNERDFTSVAIQLSAFEEIKRGPVEYCPLFK